jgi:hypothetical protein
MKRYKQQEVLYFKKRNRKLSSGRETEINDGIDSQKGRQIMEELRNSQMNNSYIRHQKLERLIYK